MVNIDEDALTCDFAETYGIYDWRSLPLKTAATLASGLRDNSRIKMKIAGLRYDMQTVMDAMVIDRLSLLVYANTEDARKKRNRPKMLADVFLKQEKDVAVTFSSGADFDAAFRALQ